MSTTTHKADAIRTIHSALRSLIAPCLRRPGDLQLHIIGNPDLPVFQLRVNREDMGRMVGKGGANLTALKALLKAMANSQGIACAMILTDPEPTQVQGSNAPVWSTTACEAALAAMLAAAGHPAPVSIVEGRPGQHLVMIGEDIPEDIEGPLSRWLNPMGVEGGTRLLLEETTESA